MVLNVICAEAYIMTNILFRKLYEKYTASPTQFIANRLARELNRLYPGDVVNAMLIFGVLSDMEFPYYLMGESAASFAAYLLGFSSANPLPPHYYCPVCHRVERAHGALDGFDLPKKVCPACRAEMLGDGHDFHFGYLYGGGLGTLLVCIPESRYYEVVDCLRRLLGMTSTECEPFSPDKFAQFGAVCISPSKELPSKCTDWHKTPTSAQIKTHALSICKDGILENDSPRNHSLLQRCADVESFYGAVRCYGIAAAAWKRPVKAAALLSMQTLPDAAIMREDVYDFFRSVGFDECAAHRQMKHFYKGRGATIDGMTREQNAFLERCSDYSYIPSRICAVEYYIAKTKLALKGGVNSR